MKSVALTDHGNMFGAFKFVAEAEKGIKPIVGCEFYLVKDRHKKTFEKVEVNVINDAITLLLAKTKKDTKIYLDSVRLVLLTVCMVNFLNR